MRQATRKTSVRRMAWGILAACIAGTSVVGCQGPGAPGVATVTSTSGSSDAPRWVGVKKSYAVAPLILIEDGDGPSGGLLPPDTSTVSTGIADPTGQQSFYVNAAAGGTLTYGRYKLTVPAGALMANAWITIKVQDGTAVDCQLTVSPAYLNGFKKPVKLTMDLTGTDVTASSISGVRIYWEQVEDLWLNVGGTKDAASLTVSTDLYHFSDYRAGW